MDNRGRRRIQVNVNGRPQTVLKTAGQASDTVHQCLMKIDNWLLHSMNIRHRPQPCGKLAVIFGCQRD